MKHGPNLNFSMYLSYRPSLVDYAARILGSREAAEDIVQEAYIRLSPTLRGDPRPKTYLFRIVRNLAVDVLRRKKLEGLRTSGNNATWVIPEAEQTPEEVLLFQESMQRAMDLLANLPEKQRLALQMHRFRGYPVERIASELGVSVQTVYRLVQSAVATITIGLGQDKVEQSASGLPKRVLSDKSRANDGD